MLILSQLICIPLNICPYLTPIRWERFDGLSPTNFLLDSLAMSKAPFYQYFHPFAANTPKIVTQKLNHSWKHPNANVCSSRVWAEFSAKMLWLLVSCFDCRISACECTVKEALSLSLGWSSSSFNKEGHHLSNHKWWWVLTHARYVLLKYVQYMLVSGEARDLCTHVWYI